MGWTESDEEEYEITEDEKKEFQDRCSKQVNLLFIVLFFDGCSLIAIQLYIKKFYDLIL